MNHWNLNIVKLVDLKCAIEDRKINILCLLGFAGDSEVKASACNAGDLGLVPGSGRFPGEGNGKPLQYSCLENPMEGGAGGLQSMGSRRVRHD